MAIVVYDADSGTIIGLSDVTIIEIPDELTDLEDMEWYCCQKLPVEKRMVEVDYAEETDARPPRNYS
jgi:hypothetical protein